MRVPLLFLMLVATPAWAVQICVDIPADKAALVSQVATEQGYASGVGYAKDVIRNAVAAHFAEKKVPEVEANLRILHAEHEGNVLAERAKIDSERTVVGNGWE